MDLEKVVRNGRVVTSSETYDADIGIADGKIAAIGKQLPAARLQDIDAAGKLVCPGFIDVHTHFDFRLPFGDVGTTDDYETGTRAAALGGVTTIVDFAFQHHGRPLDAAIEQEQELAKGKMHIDYGLHLVPTDLSVPGTLEDIAHLADHGFASIKIFTAVSGYQLSDLDVLRVLETAREIGVMVSVHAEDQSLITFLTKRYLAQGRTGVEYFPLSRPPVSEALATWRVAEYARILHVPVYFVHLSSKAALDAVRYVRDEGGEIYIETRPPYLYLDASLYEQPDRQGNKYVLFPPLRELEDQAALWQGLKNNEIQAYATDHCPVGSTDKMDPSRAFDAIPGAMSLIETSIGLLYSEGVKPGRISLNQFVSVASSQPAKLFGLWPRKGSVTIGADADLTLINPEKRFHIAANRMQSACDYDPYEGREAIGWPVMAISRGEVVAQDGEILSKPGRGELVKRNTYMPL